MLMQHLDYETFACLKHRKQILKVNSTMWLEREEEHIPGKQECLLHSN